MQYSLLTGWEKFFKKSWIKIKLKRIKLKKHTLIKIMKTIKYHNKYCNNNNQFQSNKIKSKGLHLQLKITIDNKKII